MGRTGQRPSGDNIAENLGRKDGIRAGSVSGPWRSGPARAPDPVAPVPEKQAVQVDQTPPVRAEPQSEPKGARSMIPWIAVALVFSIAIVAVAVFLGPEASGPADGGNDAVEGGGQTGIVVESPPAVETGPAPDPATAGTIRVRIGPEYDAALAGGIAAALGEAGYRSVRVETLPFDVAQSRVGYYREQDRGAALALARRVEPMAAGSGRIEVHDYGGMVETAEPGRLDLWLGRSGEDGS